MTDQEIFLKENTLFHCEKMNAELSETACIRNQQLDRSSNPGNNIRTCKGCKKGLELYSPEEDKAMEFKVCKLATININSCLCDVTDGIKGKFYRAHMQKAAMWNNKIFGTQRCGTRFHQMKNVVNLTG